MTREEQIDTAASRRANQFTHPVEWNEAYCKFREGAKWADSHPDWHKADKELPPPINAGEYFSDNVIVTDGVLLSQGYYNYICESWEIEGDIDSDEVTHWMFLPELPKEN